MDVREDAISSSGTGSIANKLTGIRRGTAKSALRGPLAQHCMELRYNKVGASTFPETSLYKPTHLHLTQHNHVL